MERLNRSELFLYLVDKIIHLHFDGNPTVKIEESTILDRIGIDSLDVIELGLDAETDLDILIDDLIDNKKIKDRKPTIGDILDIIEESYDKRK